jgi:radical SAM protein with 4Fe4S-binding SPASM domain
MDNNSKQLNFIDKIIRAKENVQRNLIQKISSTNKTEITCSGGRETAVMYPSGNIAGCEMRGNILGNLRDFNFSFKKIWFSDAANKFRNTVGNVNECNGCYHHCFISPAIFRTPAMWPKIAKSILELNK